MNNMWKFISNLFLGALAIGLTIFTGARTLHLLSEWLPANQAIMQWLGLAAFEGGFYFWSGYLATAAKGAAQRGISLVMVVISFLGIAIATISDMVMNGAADGRLPDIDTNMKLSIVVFISVVIVLNVAAFMAVKLTSPTMLKDWAMQDAEDYIEATNLQMVKRATPGLAAQAAPLMTERWVGETWNKFIPNSARPVGLAGGSQHFPDTGDDARMVQAAPVRPALPAPKEPNTDGLLKHAADHLKNIKRQAAEKMSDQAKAPAPKDTQELPVPQAPTRSFPARSTRDLRQRRMDRYKGFRTRDLTQVVVTEEKPAPATTPEPVAVPAAPPADDWKKHAVEDGTAMLARVTGKGKKAKKQ